MDTDLSRMPVSTPGLFLLAVVQRIGHKSSKLGMGVRFPPAGPPIENPPLGRVGISAQRLIFWLLRRAWQHR